MDDGAILVTGGTGFVGRRVVERLRSSGRRLTLATRHPMEAPPGCRVVVVCDIGPETAWREALAGVSAVIHLAAHVHVAPERALAEAGLFDRVNHLGTVRLHDEAAAAGVRLFLFLSSITVIGGASAPGRPFDEATEPRPETPYGRSKLAAEEALRAGSGPDLVILRPPLIAGPGVGGNLRSLARLAALPVPLPFGAIHNRRTLLSLDNLGSAIEAVLARPSPGTFVIGDRAPLSTAEIVAALRAGLGRRPGLLPVPAALIGSAARLAGFGGHAQRLLGDLEVDSSAFRERYGWRDEVETEAVLRQTAASLAGRT
ncbi:NAD-dependent epimerase/dehydratase family protein [Enterovirga rhinocerotis]|uniref:UDP-glucose 4-epimerase n=1 Tax=Enterovirga rhinocerotis TaxID=1339210 RepID=A0A4R7CAJ8_9HYPH|nr:NAD-dependent epimerase/dehydratase family protein [Enterovirga rhinocerotis]TDR93827.1 UDP-glucose 4-epimerase [Enterovirga rhinocerotis]